MSPDEAIKILEFNLNDEADEKSLKKQYRLMALKYHPDRNKDPATNDKFHKITEAYNTLTKYLKERVKQKEFITLTAVFYGTGQGTTATQQGNMSGFDWS
jgi:DnaJ-class molecular chaperone